MDSGLILLTGMFIKLYGKRVLRRLQFRFLHVAYLLCDLGFFIAIVTPDL